MCVQCVQAMASLKRQGRPEPNSKGIEPFPLLAQTQQEPAGSKGQAGGSVASPPRMDKDPGAERILCHTGAEWAYQPAPGHMADSAV